MFTADQITAHLFGDYVLQSHWMATEKTKRWLPAIIHALTYSALFWLWLGASGPAWIAIMATHFVIDRYRLARWVVIIKNLMSPAKCWGVPRDATGFPEGTPAWLSVWLLIIVDNILHMVINGVALRWL